MYFDEIQELLVDDLIEEEVREQEYIELRKKGKKIRKRSQSPHSTSKTAGSKLSNYKNADL